MEKQKFFNIKMIVTTGILTAVQIVLQLLSSIIPTGVNLNLSLVTITLGAVLYGPYIGGFLGLVCGVTILLSPATQFFYGLSIPGTFLACLLKTTVAGLVAGFVFKPFKEKNELLGMVLASITVPLLNSLIFVFVSFFFFMEPAGMENIWILITAWVGFNFIFEILTNVIITPTAFKVLKEIKR